MFVFFFFKKNFNNFFLPVSAAREFCFVFNFVCCRKFDFQTLVNNIFLTISYLLSHTNFLVRCGIDLRREAHENKEAGVRAVAHLKPAAIGKVLFENTSLMEKIERYLYNYPDRTKTPSITVLTRLYTVSP